MDNVKRSCCSKCGNMGVQILVMTKVKCNECETIKVRARVVKPEFGR